MFYKLFALFAVLAVAFANPNPKPEPQAAYTVGVAYPGYAAYSPYTYGAVPYAAAAGAYPYAYTGAYYVR